MNTFNYLHDFFMVSYYIFFYVVFYYRFLYLSLLHRNQPNSLRLVMEQPDGEGCGGVRRKEINSKTKTIRRESTKELNENKTKKCLLYLPKCSYTGFYRPIQTPFLLIPIVLTSNISRVKCEENVSCRCKLPT